MTFQSIPMYAFLSVALILLGSSRLARIKRPVFLLLNLAFIMLGLTHSRLFSMIILLAWVISHYLSLQILLRVSAKRAVFLLWLLLTLAWFLIAKEYLWITQGLLRGRTLNVWWSVVGYSFILFRQIHLSVNVCGGMIRSVRFLDYLNYTLAFWTFLAGPIQRYDDFIEQMHASETIKVGNQDALRGFNRMLWGLIKMGVIAPFFESKAVITTFTGSPGFPGFLLFFLAFPLYMYLNFSGYCDAVIGLARTVGFRIPENFRKPFAARNMLDFWSRWHISLSEFFRDYLYFPMLTAVSRRHNVLRSSLVVTFISFFLMGIWHGNDVRFAYFGILHGLGVCVALLYGVFLKRALSKEGLRRYRRNPFIRGLAVGICQTYVMSTFLVFHYSFADLRQLFLTLKGLVL